MKVRTRPLHVRNDWPQQICRTTVHLSAEFWREKFTVSQQQSREHCTQCTRVSPGDNMKVSTIKSTDIHAPGTSGVKRNPTSQDCTAENIFGIENHSYRCLWKSSGKARDILWSAPEVHRHSYARKVWSAYQIQEPGCTADLNPNLQPNPNP